MRLLDLFCGAGGAAMGYYRAGFTEIVGVDIAPQKHYPFEFIQGDALEYATEHGKGFDLIHASPPCLAYTRLRTLHPDKNYLDLVGPTRDLLESLGIPYVIENVTGAPLLSPVMLCGTFFGLKVYRHRLFESNPMILLAPPHRPHNDQTPRAGYGISPKGFISIAGKGGFRKQNRYAYKAMGIDWDMTLSELSKAIPPAYTEWIGQQMRRLI